MNVPSPGSQRSLVSLAKPYFGVLVVSLVFLIAVGIYNLFEIPSGVYPEVAFPRIAVIASVPGLAIKTVEVAVTRTLEEAVAVVLGVSRVRARTIRGASEINIDFAPGTDMVQALNDVRSRVAEANAALAQGTQLIVERMTPSVFPIISIAVSGGESLADLREYALYDLKPRISRLPDVSYVTVQGGDVREVLIEVDPLALAAAHVSVDELSVELGRSERIKAVGRIDRGRLQYQVMANTLAENPEELEDLVIGGTPREPLRLGTVARVSISHEDRLVAVRSRGRDAVAVTVFRRLGGDALTVSKRLAAVLDEARGSAPVGVTIRTVYDQAELVRTSLANVRDAIIVGGIFSVLTLFAFLRDVRATLIAAIAIPATLLVTFVFLRWSGSTLNLMSLGGLAIAIGLIIDDTVVVIENIARHIEAGQAGGDAIDTAAREISGAVIGSTLTTVLVFVPLAFITGVVGQFFQSLCLALGTAVLVSMVISLTVIPMLSARFLAGRALPPAGRIYRRSAELYERALRAGLRWPRATLAMAILCIVPGYLLYGRLETGFMPEMDEGAFVLDYFMPVGTSLVETDRVLRRVEAILAKTPEVEDYIRRTGAELGLFATEPYTGDVLVSLIPGRRRSLADVTDEIRGTIEEEVPELKLEFVPLVSDQINDLSGVEAPVEVKVFGPDYAVLREIAGEIGKALEQIHGIDDLDPHVRQGNPDIVVRADSAAARRAGLSADAVETQLEAALYGRVALTLPQADRLTKVRIRYPDRVRFDLDQLASVPLTVPAGGMVPLGQVARIEETRSLNELLRENQQPMIKVTAEIVGSDLGTVNSQIRTALSKLELPKGYRCEVAGNYESQRQAFWSLGTVLVLGAGLVFLFLAVQFRSLALPLVIFLTQPLSLTCALVALWIAGKPLNVSSYMGAILLVGLDMKNGILLIEYVGQRCRSGAALEDALLQAGRARFRPILMTSLATILGLLPLALGIGPGAQMQQPLAIAVIGGLAANMLFTRLVIPVGYLLVAQMRGGTAEPA